MVRKERFLLKVPLLKEFESLVDCGSLYLIDLGILLTTGNLEIFSSTEVALNIEQRNLCKGVPLQT